MIKYAKVTNKKTGAVDVTTGDYQPKGFTQLNVRKSDIDNNWYLYDKAPMMTEEEKEKQEKEEIRGLSLTKREVFLAVYKNKGITPDEIRSKITNPEALIEFDYANEYFRGNPLIDSIGEALGYTEEDLDNLFIKGELNG